MIRSVATLEWSPNTGYSKLYQCKECVMVFVWNLGPDREPEKCPFCGESA